MKRTDILKILLVVLVLAPLVFISSGVGKTPDWMDGRFAGVPLTVVATSLWFITMMALTAIFARMGMDSGKLGGDK